jgi:SAM-dependent methyltransferase
MSKRLLNKVRRTLSAIEIRKPTLEETYARFVDLIPAVIRYREAYFATRGHVAPGAALPMARAWPEPDEFLSYKRKLLSGMASGDRVVEIGPLNIPIVLKDEANVLYVDHLDTAGLHAKYPGVDGIVEIDRAMADGTIAGALSDDGQFDYIVASQVMEHVPDAISWLQDCASVLRVGGRLAISLPDRETTFDLIRDETRPADMVTANFQRARVPDVRAVYDNQTLAAYISMHFLNPASLFSADIIKGRGAIPAPIIQPDPMAVVQRSHAGEYLDAHCWVFTSPSFLMLMARLAMDEFIPFRCKQFYPTSPKSYDRGSASFITILEKVGNEISLEERSRSFLLALGD